MKKTYQQNVPRYPILLSLVDQYPEWSVAWYAVGCYYYNVGKQDNARK